MEVALMKARNIFVLSLIVLAIIGLGSVLIGNPLSLLRQIFIMAAAIGIIYFIYRKWISGKPTKNKEQKAFQKAAKQSKKRFKKKVTKSTQSANHAKKRPIRRKSNANLTVIEGKKNKKNNRASF
jgi:hypothetical protein